MTSGITNAQLQQIIEEVERMKKEEQSTLSREEVKQVLEELNLPADLVDEAIVRVNQRLDQDSYEKNLRRIYWIAGTIVLATIAAVFFGFQQRQAKMSQVTAAQDRLTLTQDDGSNLTVVNRQQSPEVVYRVTLAQAPVGDRLTLSCNWTDPTGVIVKQNRYETKQITTPVWNTYCRMPLGSGTTAGTWTVEMFLGDRPLESAQFQVQ
ncbi:hypothetical protein [Leptolyngbya sp. O-77]|uniref:hypothetical protein n=1 Tax=Leptolyngbya sp. O-77 TaxID=1080068 RepID=UPI00074D387A|nr:hypothetical protein [Leptolyngbya sp. O-77]BAU43044.1 hypothetical protein O77CONTIG1_02866 [Leptolyngbya sp. O-77]